MRASNSYRTITGRRRMSVTPQNSRSMRLDALGLLRSKPGIGPHEFARLLGVSHRSRLFLSLLSDLCAEAKAFRSGSEQSGFRYWPGN